MPTEIKIIYDIKENKVNANYKYESVYSNKGKFADSVVEKGPCKDFCVNG